MCDLLSVLKNERQQCQYKHTKNHKILEGEIYHRHHLHSEEFRQCPTLELRLSYTIFYHIKPKHTTNKL